MNNTYADLVQQTFHFPQEGFDTNDNNTLEFNGVDISSFSPQATKIFSTSVSFLKLYLDIL